MAAIGTTVNSSFDPWAVQLHLDEKDARYAMAAYAQPAPGGVMSYKSGVFAGGAVAGTTLGNANHGGLRVAVGTTGSSPTVTVAIGNALIDTPSNGPYLCSLDSQKTISLATPSSTQRRIDLIVARVYDDRNSAIGSTSGDRRFVVQAVTGDNTSGTPVVPTATLPTNGWIPLAAVQIEANGSTMTLTDMRGPGLVARGGKRILYGNDAKITSAAFLEAGAYAGDQRYVVGHPFPSQTYYVSSDAGSAGWRGDGGRILFNTYPVSAGIKSISGEGTTNTIISVTIPAFGIPVTICPVFHFNPTMSGGQLLEVGTALDGGLATNDHISTAGWSSTRTYPKQLGSAAFGPFTTAKTVSAFARPIVQAGGSTITYNSGDAGPNALQVVVEPANIDSSKMWL